MNRISILDCTLRDGGYVNDFRFGLSNMQNIIELLCKANVDIVECGFLQSGKIDEDKSLFNNVSAIKKVIINKAPTTMYVAMIQVGKIPIEEIVDYDGTSIDGIRITFHESEIEEAFTLARQLKAKGYKIFIQPVGTSTYTDYALLQLILKVNELNPYSFYLVDTLGTMYQNDIRRFFYLIDNNLDKHICVGFHSHNNLQQAFSNSQELLQINTPRHIIIDSTVQGLGRGAGNLCTELILRYVNENKEYTYDMLPILRIIDEFISPMHLQYQWGYAPAYYLAAIKNCHPNYASYLLNMQTLAAEDIDRILNKLPLDKKMLYDEEYIGQIYIEYKTSLIDDRDTLNALKAEIAQKDLLLLASGKSVQTISSEWRKKLEENYYIISVNFVPTNITCNRCFFTNKKRYMAQKKFLQWKKLILSSNLENSEMYDAVMVNYSSYVNGNPIISDNAGLMCINMLKAIGCTKLALIGFDGYHADQMQNYFTDSLVVEIDVEKANMRNKAIAHFIKNMRKEMEIEFLTDSYYDE